MTKAEQARALSWRLKILRYAQGEPRQVARTCRHFGVSRTLFYRWKRRFETYGEAGLADRPRTPLRSPRATAPAGISDDIHLFNQNCVSGRTTTITIVRTGPSRGRPRSND